MRGRPVRGRCEGGARRVLSPGMHPQAPPVGQSRRLPCAGRGGTAAPGAIQLLLAPTPARCSVFITSKAGPGPAHTCSCNCPSLAYALCLE